MILPNLPEPTPHPIPAKGVAATPQPKGADFAALWATETTVETTAKGAVGPEIAVDAPLDVGSVEIIPDDVEGVLPAAPKAETEGAASVQRDDPQDMIATILPAIETPVTRRMPQGENALQSTFALQAGMRNSAMIGPDKPEIQQPPQATTGTAAFADAPLPEAEKPVLAMQAQSKPEPKLAIPTQPNPPSATPLVPSLDPDLAPRIGGRTGRPQSPTVISEIPSPPQTVAPAAALVGAPPVTRPFAFSPLQEERSPDVKAPPAPSDTPKAGDRNMAPTVQPTAPAIQAFAPQTGALPISQLAGAALSNGDDPLTEDAGLPPLQAPQLSGSPAAAAAVPYLTARPAHPPISRQVTEAFMRSEGGRTEIALNPEELGRVRFAMVTTDAGMTLAITTERPETADLIRRNLEDLAREFREMGFENLAFSFDDAPQGDQSGLPFGHAAAEQTFDDPPAADMPSVPQKLRSGLDLKL